MTYEIFYNRTRKRWPFNIGDCISSFDCTPRLNYYVSKISTGWRFPGLKLLKLLSTCTSLADVGSPLDKSDCQVIIQKTWSWTIVGNSFGEYHTPCTLKTSFVDLKKESVHSEQPKNIKFFTPTQLDIFFQWLSKVVNSADPSLPSFQYTFHIIYEIVLVLNIAEILLAGC
jgi:hypothetical protein